MSLQKPTNMRKSIRCESALSSSLLERSRGLSRRCQSSLYHICIARLAMPVANMFSLVWCNAGLYGLPRLICSPDDVTKGMFTQRPVKQEFSCGMSGMDTLISDAWDRLSRIPALSTERRRGAPHRLSALRDAAHMRDSPAAAAYSVCRLCDGSSARRRSSAKARRS